MNDQSIRRNLALRVGLFLFAVYLLSYRGGFHSVDEVSMFAVTESLAKFGQVNTDQIAWTQWTTSQAEAQGFFGQDGRVYSKKGLALSLAQLPLYLLALTLPGLGMLQTVSLLNAALTAATGLLVLMFAWRLGYGAKIALLTALSYGLATIAFVYAKYLFSEPLAGFLLLLTAYMLFTYRQEAGLRHLAIAGLAAGLAVLARANNLFLLPIFGLYLGWVALHCHPAERPRPALTWRSSTFSVGRVSVTIDHAPLLIFALAVALSGLILLSYNAARSGDPLQTGYDLSLFSSNALLGFYKLLFSPLRGLFVYSPILLLSLPGWWLFRRRFPAEAWLFIGCIGLTVGLFSFWSSGEGLSWGSRFLVPIVPFLALLLAPVLESLWSPSPGQIRPTHSALRLTFYLLLPLSLLIQLLGITINPWVFLAQIQAEFGGEFFLEHTAAFYDFRYSQVAGQLQSWSLENSDLAWLRWGFDSLAFGLSFGLALLSGWFLWQSLIPCLSNKPTHYALRTTPFWQRSAYYLIPLTLAITYILLIRYNQTDRQFGPPNDGYTQALNTAAARAGPDDQIISVAQYHYHVPMNRFRARLPLLGLAQQKWPPPETALPLLAAAANGPTVWLITVGFPPAAANNAAEQWLAGHTYKASDEWFDDSVRLVRYSTSPPTITRPLTLFFGPEQIKLSEVRLRHSLEAGQSLPVELIWQPTQPPQADYNLFLQLLNREGTLMAQLDSPPNGGYSPTSTWSATESVLTRQALVLPPTLPPGDYRLIAGLYDLGSGQRLRTNTGSDFVELGNVTIIAGKEEEEARSKK